MKYPSRRRAAELESVRFELELEVCRMQAGVFGERIRGRRMPWLLGEGFVLGATAGLISGRRVGGLVALANSIMGVATRIPYATIVSAISSTLVTAPADGSARKTDP